MQTPLRNVRALFVCLSAVSLFPALVHAEDWKSYKPQGYVSDFANVVNPESKQLLESYAARVRQITGVQLAFVTIPSTQGEPVENVANDLFHAFGVGQQKEDNGALFLLSVQDRKSRLEVGGGLGGIIPDGMAGQLLDEMRPALRKGSYGPALLVAAQELGNTVAKSKGLTIPAPELQQHKVEPGTRDSIPWPIVLIGIFILLFLFRGGGRFGGGPYGRGGGGFWTGMLLGQLLNSGRGSWGGRDGGGFGGFDSGGSGGGFGGFGGGDSGGGGASSDW